MPTGDWPRKDGMVRRPPKKAGPVRLLLAWATTDTNPFFLLLAALGCVGGGVYAQQIILVSLAAIAGLLLSGSTAARVVAAGVIAVVWYAAGDMFWKALALNDKIGNWAWRLEHAPMAVAVGYAAGVVLGTAARWLFGAVGDAAADEDDDEDNETETVVKATREEPVDPERTVDQDPAAPDPVAPVAFGDVGEYEVVSEVGRGGMGVVFKAKHRGTGRVVALKMTLAKTGSAVKAVERFRGEAESVAKVDHPGIVPVYEFGDHHGRQFFTMGFVDGPSLSARLTAGPLEPGVAAYVVRQAAEAVAVAHAQGIIHRDLKPGNILLDRGGDTRVTDFGLARRVDATDAEDGGDADAGAEAFPDTMMTVQRLTATGAVMGTPAYMAPEQALDAKRVGPPADVWGLGAVLYACLTGRPPFHGASMAETLTLVIEADPRPPGDMAAGLDGDLEAVCLKCLQKDPADRYATAGELAADLTRWEAGKTPLAARVGLFERLRRLEAAHPEGLPVLAGLAAYPAASVQESVFVGAAVAGTFVAYRAPRAPGFVRSALLWVVLAAGGPLYTLTDFSPVTASQRADWQRAKKGLPPGYTREREEWDRFIAAQEAAAAERVRRVEIAAGAAVLIAALFGLGLAVGARSVGAAAPDRPDLAFGYRAALLFSPVLVVGLGAFFDKGNSQVSRAVRWCLPEIAPLAGAVFAAAVGVAAGVVVHGAVRRLAGPTRTGAKGAAFAARLAAAGATVALLWAAREFAPPAAHSREVVAAFFGPGPLLAVTESVILGWPGWANEAYRPAAFLAKFLVLTAPMALAAVAAAVLLRGKKFR